MAGIYYPPKNTAQPVEAPKPVEQKPDEPKEEKPIVPPKKKSL